MRRSKISILMAILVVLATFVFAITVDAVNMRTQQANQIVGQKHIINDYNPQSLFFAEITFNLYEGTGCGCVPVRNASITAWGLDVDHNASGITDDDGKCILQLEINYNYRVTIEAEGLQTVMFDFLILDDQTFVFHLGEAGGSSLEEVLLFYNPIAKMSK
jgi:hypothetical protein